MHYLWLGILLGLGAAIPIGPLNLEILRRNLTMGTIFGMALGFGACLADMTYLAFLVTGALQLLITPWIVFSVGVLSAGILGWFGWSAFKAPPMIHQSELHVVRTQLPPWRHTVYKDMF